MRSLPKRKVVAALLAAAPGALAVAQESAARSPDPGEPSTLWWMWLLVALVLLAAMVALFFTQEPRSRAAENERARRIVHGRDEPRPSER